MTDRELAGCALSEVLALLEKATPGPWVSVARGDYGSGAEGSIDGAGEADVEPAVAPPYDAPTIRGEVMLADAEAIAAAINFLRKHGPALLAALSTPSSEGDGRVGAGAAIRAGKSPPC